MEQDKLDEITERNPNVDPTALARSRQAVRQLAEVGIKLGGYRLTPALSGTVTKSSHTFTGQGISGTQTED